MFKGHVPQERHADTQDILGVWRLVSHPAQMRSIGPVFAGRLNSCGAATPLRTSGQRMRKVSVYCSQLMRHPSVPSRKFLGLAVCQWRLSQALSLGCSAGTLQFFGICLKSKKGCVSPSLIAS